MKCSLIKIESDKLTKKLNYISKRVESERAYKIIKKILQEQENFFRAIQNLKPKKEITEHVIKYKNAITKPVKSLDKLLGHGKLFKSFEVFFKCVCMVLGSLIIALNALSNSGRQDLTNFFSFYKTKNQTKISKYDKKVSGICKVMEETDDTLDMEASRSFEKNKAFLSRKPSVWGLKNKTIVSIEI